MKIDLFASILIILGVTLIAKGAAVFTRIQEHTKYAFSTTSNSVFLDVAYAKSETQNDSQQPLPDMNQISQPNPDNTQEFNNNNVNQTNRILKTNLPQIESSNLNSDEVRLLKELSKRREELDKTQEALQIKANMLKATENQLDQKLHDLQSLQSQVEEVMKAYTEKENGKIKSLVRIYENMKPKDAAKIFDALEMPILLDIVSHMKETKVSPILAAMQTNKASELSVELTKQKSVLDQR